MLTLSILGALEFHPSLPPIQKHSDNGRLCYGYDSLWLSWQVWGNIRLPYWLKSYFQLFFFWRYWGYYSRANEAWAKHWATNGVSSLSFLSLLLLRRTIFTQCFSDILFDHVFNVWFSQSTVDWSHYCWTFSSCSYTEMLALEFFWKMVFADTYVLWLLNLVLRNWSGV